MEYIDRIKAHAEATGYSIHGLFVAANVRHSNWYRWRDGKTMPTMRTMNKLLSVPPKAIA